MINFGIGLAFVGTLGVIMTTLYGTVTTLPFGLQEPMEFFMENVNIIRNLMPWFDTIWRVFVIALMVKTALFFMSKFMWIVQLIRG